MARKIVNLGAAPNDLTGDKLRVGGAKINDNFEELYKAQGWALYTDTTYTDVSPFTILSGVRTKIPNDSGAGITTQLPLDTATFYNSVTGKLIGTNDGDLLSVTLRFKAKMSVNNGYFDLDIDIAGTQGIISGESVIFSRVANTEQRFDIDLDYFTGSTFLANGGDFNITPLNGDLEMYDIQFLIKRLIRGK